MLADQTTRIVETFIENELQTSSIYERLSKTCGDAFLSEKLHKSSEIEEEHVKFWTRFLENRDRRIREIKISSLKVFFYLVLYRMIGFVLTLKWLERTERDSIGNYSKMLKDFQLSDEEVRGLRKILEDELDHEEQFEDYGSTRLFFIEQVSVIFTQMSYGLATVLSISVGFSVFYSDPMNVALPALIVGLSGSISSALSFYFYGLTQKRLKLEILDRINSVVEIVPQIFLRRIDKYMKKRKLSEATAKNVAEEASKNKDLLKRIVAEEEYGIRIEALGNPVKTFAYVVVLRTIGTILPLMPFLLSRSTLWAIIFSIIITLILLVVSGFMVALSAETSIKKKIFEFSVIGMTLTLLTLFIGFLTSMIREML